MRIDHISESHPILNATKKKGTKKRKKREKQKGNFASAQYKKKRHKLKTILKKKGENVCGGSPQIFGTKNSKRKKTKSASHAENNWPKFHYLCRDTLSFKEVFFPLDFSFWWDILSRFVAANFCVC
jgi:diphthamide synthase subunit DPH2